MKYLPHLTILTAFLLLLLACTSQQSVIINESTPSVVPSRAVATKTPQPTKSATPPYTLTPTETPPAWLVRLRKTPSPTPVPSSTPTVTSTPDLFSNHLRVLLKAQFSIEKIKVMPLNAEQPLWLAYTYGQIRDFPLESHLLIIYTKDNENWRELGRISLGEEPQILVKAGQISIEPNNLWIHIDGGWGVYSACNILVRFDGQDLHKEVSHCNRYDAGRFEDVNHDGIMEVVQDWTNYSVYCGACQERLTNFEILRWNGQQFIDVDLQLLDTSVPDEIRQLNNLAVALAQAELWKDAQGTIDQASKLDDQNVTVTWNKTLIDLQANERRKEANSFLTTLFFGAYDSVLDMMREYSVQELFETPVELTTITEFDDGWQKEATINWVLKMTDSTIEYQPEFAPAYFLRGWAKYLNDDLSALQDIDQAVQLDPTEPLFSEGLEYLQNIN